ncbi:hypothetical protein RCS94_06405 [Orbaceae bacterium ac157xtp]
MNKKVDQPSAPPQLSQSAINKLLENQAKELELRNQELMLRKAEIDNNQAYSLKALEAQKEDRRETRQTYKSIMKLRTALYSVCFICILMFCSYAIFMGETQIIMEALKVALPAIATGVGGFYFGKNKGAESERNKDQV